MFGDLVFKVLNIIERSALVTADIIDVLTSGYEESYKKMKGYRSKTFNSSTSKENQKFYSILNYLQKQNLITKNKKESGLTAWLITKKGKEKLSWLRKNFSQHPVKKNYPIYKADNLIIVSFDIPEIYKKKRVWLRGVLRGFDYKMIQKSVWIGHNALPPEFLKDLRDFNLMSYIQIFSVYKSGTIPA
jgi:DNA-binding PadR family transcriptional regulator